MMQHDSHLHLCFALHFSHDYRATFTTRAKHPQTVFARSGGSPFSCVSLFGRG